MRHVKLPTGKNVYAADSGGGTNAPLSKKDGLAAFFGIPNRPYEETNARYSHMVENYDLPDAYIGRNELLTYILISEVTKSQKWMVLRLLPYKYAHNPNIEYEIWKFADHLLGRTPEESVSRMLTSNFEKGAAYMHRQGIAFIVEHGFYLTEKGRRQFAMNLKQIAFACEESACLNAILACYEWFKPDDPYKHYRPEFKNTDITTIEKYLNEGQELFGLFQKDRHALDHLISAGKTAIEGRGQHGQYLLVIPERSMRFLRNDPQNFVNLYKNNNAPDMENRSSVMYNGIEIYETRSFRTGERQANWDPAYRKQYIGGFNTMMVNHLIDTVPNDEYRTNMMDIVIYDEAIDDFQRMSYREMARLSGLYTNWHSDHPQLNRAYGNEFFKDFTKGTWGEACDKAGIKKQVVDLITNSLPPRVYKLFIDGLSATGALDRFNESNSSPNHQRTSHVVPSAPELTEFDLQTKRSESILFNSNIILDRHSVSVPRMKGLLNALAAEDRAPENLKKHH
jgi:hypothetical protein